MSGAEVEVEVGAEGAVHAWRLTMKWNGRLTKIWSLNTKLNYSKN